MRESQSFSVGVDRLLQAVQPHGQLVSCYPGDLDEARARRNSGESLHAWFCRIVNQCGGDPQHFALEDNLAVFVRLGWKDRKQLRYANVQTICTTCHLVEYYLEGGCDATYLRLDFDYTSLGDPFSHPLAHIHVEGDRAPRFALDGGNAGNISFTYYAITCPTWNASRDSSGSGRTSCSICIWTAPIG
jgi:hypothetical protein